MSTRNSKYSKYGVLGRNMEKIPLLIAIALIMGVLSSLSPYFLTWDNLTMVSRQVSINMIVTVGMTFVVITGGIDLSVGSVLALTNCVISTCMAVYGWHPAVSVLAGIAVATFVGFCSGILVAKVKIPPFIATLGMMTIIRGTAYVYTDATPVSGLPKSYNAIGDGSFLFLPTPLWITILVLCFGHFLLSKTVSGNHIYAIGNNQESARLAGINIDRTIIKVYMFSGLMCAVASMILTSRLGSGQPSGSSSAEMDAISAAVLGGVSLSGGVGNISGAMLGALIIGFINNGMNMLRISAYYQMIVKGVVIVIAIGINTLSRRKSEA